MAKTHRSGSPCNGFLPLIGILLMAFLEFLDFLFLAVVFLTGWFCCLFVMQKTYSMPEDMSGPSIFSWRFF